MPYYSLPTSSNGASRFSPTDYSDLYVIDRVPTPHPGTNHTPLEEEHPLRFPEEAAQRLPTSESRTIDWVCRGSENLSLGNPHPIPPSPQPVSPCKRISLSEGRTKFTAVNITTSVNFPSPVDTGCPFRLLECAHFVNTGGLVVREFDEDFLSATVDMNIESLKKMEAWSTRVPWVAVSYDTSQTCPLAASGSDSKGVPTFQLAADDFIRVDVLKLLCEAAIHRFGADYLWLDKLCAFQNSNSEAEKCRWRMPGNVKRAFGFAKGILVLPNGLCRLPPSLQSGGTRSAGFSRSRDFASSLRIFLELAFNRSLKEVHVPIIGPFNRSAEVQDEVPLYWSCSSEPRRHVKVYESMPAGDAGTIRFEDFLEAAQEVGSLRLEPNGSSGAMTVLVINTFGELPHGQDHTTREGSKRALQVVKTFLALLRCRDKLRQPPGTCMAPGTARDTGMTGDWEIAIWYNVLVARTAASCGQFVFGLAWLLQDLCDAQRRHMCQWFTTTRTDIRRGLERSFTDRLGLKWHYSDVDSQHAGTKFDTQQPELHPEPVPHAALDLVAGVMIAAREWLDKITGEVDLNVPFVQIMLSLMVRKVNEIRVSGLSDEFMKMLPEGTSWPVSLPPQWISIKPARAQSSPQTWSPCSFPDSDPAHPEIGYLGLTIAYKAVGGPILAIRLTGREGYRILRNLKLSPPTQNPLPKDSTVQTEVHFIPAKIWRVRTRNSDRDEFWVQYLELQFDSNSGCWQILKCYYCIPSEPFGSSLKTRKRSYPLTPEA